MCVWLQLSCPRLILIALATACLGPPLLAQEAVEPTIKRPAYTFLRFNEDWSVLRGGSPAGGDDLWDPIKYVPLNEIGDVWMSFGGHFRARWEVWRNFNFGDAPTDSDDFLLYRKRSLWLTRSRDVRFLVSDCGKHAYRCCRSSEIVCWVACILSNQ